MSLEVSQLMDSIGWRLRRVDWFKWPGLNVGHHYILINAACVIRSASPELLGLLKEITGKSPSV